MRCVEQCWLVKTERDGYSDGLCRLCAPARRTVSPLRREGRTPFREPLQFIVITVMSVIGSTFPHTYGVIYMTVKDEGFGDRHVIVMVSVMEK